MIIFGLTAVLISALFAVWEKNIVHYHRSIFNNEKTNFWNLSESWKNKYKDGDPTKGPKFLFSDTFLAFLTDGYHLIKSIIISLFMLILSINTENVIINLFIGILIYTFVFGLLFNLILDTENTFKEYIFKKISDIKSFFNSLTKIFNKNKKNGVK